MSSKLLEDAPQPQLRCDLEVASAKPYAERPLFGWGTMTKADIVQAIYSQLGGFSKKEAADLVELVFESMKETLGRGERIKVSGFGNFVLRDKRPRQGRNPKTGDPMLITGRRVLSFKPSNILKHGLNPTRGKAAKVDAPSSEAS
jgi:integration host factor subunit alpha